MCRTLFCRYFEIHPHVFSQKAFGGRGVGGGCQAVFIQLSSGHADSFLGLPSLSPPLPSKAGFAPTFASRASQRVGPLPAWRQPPAFIPTGCR